MRAGNDIQTPTRILCFMPGSSVTVREVKCSVMEILKTFSILLSIAVCLVNSSGENLHHKCIHDRIAVSGFS